MTIAQSRKESESGVLPLDLGQLSKKNIMEVARYPNRGKR